MWITFFYWATHLFTMSREELPHTLQHFLVLSLDFGAGVQNTDQASLQANEGTQPCIQQKAQ